MNYSQLLNEIFALQEEGLEIYSIGQSTMGQEIYATHVGSYDGKQIIIQGAIHGREWITAFLLIKLASYTKNQFVDGGVYYIFTTNPDGVRIAMDGIGWLRCNATKNYLTYINNSANFSLYKANANGVDLNTNFNALWGSGAQNVFCPSSENFVGFYPNSERETRVLIDFTNLNNPALTISYHSKGEVIYYGFEGQDEQDLTRDRNIANALSSTTGYVPILTQNSAGGYKDWCINKKKIPAYTIEVGGDNLNHPIGLNYLDEIFEKNKDVPLTAFNEISTVQNLSNGELWKKI